MLDSNENKSKNSKTFHEWASTNEVNYEKQILPGITDFKQFVEFVNKRWDLLKSKLEKELKF